MTELQARLDREEQFWDGRQPRIDALDPDLYRVAAADRTDRSVAWLDYLGFPALIGCVIGRIGPVAGRRILDLGCGSGFVAALLAAQGAKVDAVDVSEASLEVARWRAEISGVADRVAFHHAAVEALPFETSTFDAVCGAFVLHHLDLSLAGPELRRVLRPAGRGAFIETSGGSTILMAARRLLTGSFGIERASSEDEAPIARPALAELRRTFGSEVQVVCPETLFLRMLSYVSPLHKPPAQAVLAAGDRLLHRLPGFRSRSYYAVVCLGPSPPGG